MSSNTLVDKLHEVLQNSDLSVVTPPINITSSISIDTLINERIQQTIQLLIPQIQNTIMKAINMQVESTLSSIQHDIYKKLSVLQLEMDTKLSKVHTSSEQITILRDEINNKINLDVPNIVKVLFRDMFSKV